MNRKELIKRLREIRDLGFVRSSRIGPTGIGKTFEDLLGIAENNLALPDLGRLEIKTARKGSNSLITLFTFNRGVWQIDQKNLIETYGYTDNKGRKALKKTLTYGLRGDLYLELDEENKTLLIKSTDFGFYILSDANPKSFVKGIKSGAVAI
jgi:hypothetical protein